MNKNAAYHREVLRRMPGALAAVVLVEGDIQNPVKGVLYFPVRPYRAVQKSGIGWKAADIETGLFLRFAGRLHVTLGPVKKERGLSMENYKPIEKN